VVHLYLRNATVPTAISLHAICGLHSTRTEGPRLGRVVLDVAQEVRKGRIHRGGESISGSLPAKDTRNSSKDQGLDEPSRSLRLAVRPKATQGRGHLRGGHPPAAGLRGERGGPEQRRNLPS